MRDAVLRDFSQIDGLEIIQTCDARLTPPLNAIIAQPSADVWALWADCIRLADAVLFIAPETGGVLTRLTRLAESLNKPVLGADSNAVAMASDKWLTYQQLQLHQIPSIAAYLYEDFPKHQTNSWVAKPRDGAGCADMAYFETSQALEEWMETRKQSHIIQPNQKGESLSFSMLCKQGQAYLLSCNQQKITIANDAFSYSGGVINGARQHELAFEALAGKIARAMTGLNGYVGVDVIVDEVEGEYFYYVVEINPRITTSYVALHEACGLNPARMLLDLFYNETFQMPVIAHHKVDISLHAST